ncbi:acyl carrier protein [Streptomyces sp. NPDC048282]|uniref:acyl carrier protein n=1 Tax=Streptomyces sp. NPDC048282 TaxID=3365528 RepID=UPI003714F43F
MTVARGSLDGNITHAVREILDLPASERRDALENLVVTEFKATLLMPDDEELPLEVSYFELGFTSLRITEAKQRLEGVLGRPISTNLLFNRPTVEQLLDHLETDVFADLFATAPAAEPDGARSAEQALWDAALDDLYQG